MSRPGAARHPLLSPVAIALAAFAVRIAFAVSMGNRYYFADTVEYEASALSLLAGHGPGGHTPRAPLYPAFMALGFLLGGSGNYLLVRMLQCVLGTFVVGLTAIVTERLAGRGAAIFAGLLMAFGPLYVFTSAMLYPTTLYTLLLLAGVAMAIELSENPRPLPAVVLGLSFVLGWLSDPVMVAPIAGVLGWLVWQIRRRGLRLAGMIGLALAVMLAVAAPYMRWQREAFGREAVFMQKAQYVLWWARTDTTMTNTRWIDIRRDTTFVPLAAREFLRQESALFRDHPLAYVHDVASEFLHFFKPVPDRVQTKNQYNQPHVLWIAALHFVPVTLLAIAGLILGAAPLRKRVLLLGVVLATALFYSFFFTQTRYRIPVEPYLVILAAAGFARLFPRLAAWLGGSEAPGPAGSARA